MTETSVGSPGVTSPLKRKLLTAFVGALGAVLALALLAGGLLWYISRPKPPKLWNAKAIVVSEPPGFVVSDDGKRFEFTYTLENKTDEDYRISQTSDVNFTFVNSEGTVETLFPSGNGVSNVPVFSVPVFVPAHQKAVLDISFPAAIPKREPGQTDEQYHEQLRSFLNAGYSHVGGFVIFDERFRYQVNLPKWLAEPKEKS
jgi:hypothetical protein